MSHVEAEILGVRIQRRSRQEALGAIRELLARGEPHSVYFVNAATANLAFEDPAYCAALNRGDLVLNDGIGVKLAARSLGLFLEDNLVGTDLVCLLFQEVFERPLRTYLLGGRPGGAERAARHIRGQYPLVEVIGSSHGYFPPEEEPAVVETIHHLLPDLLLVGMGNPRQELFIDRHLAQLGCRVAVGVGGLFDHFSGDLRRAPPLVRRWGLEWAQLLLQQPHKWRRYLLGNPKFLWRTFRRTLFHTARNGGVAVLSLALALVVAERIVRLAQPQILERYPEGLYVPSPTRQYKLRPHFRGVFRYPEFETEVRINGQGLRGQHDYGPPEPGVRRVLALGDSFTMGYSVGEAHTWVRLLERLLPQREPAVRYEVINAGVPGYSTRQELAYLEEEGVALAPDVVLLGFFIGNDITDNAHPLLPVELREGRLIAASAKDGLLPFPFRLYLATHSHLYHVAWLSRRRAGEERYAIHMGRADAGWQATAELIDRLARLCSDRHIRLVVLLIPERLQVETEARRRLGITFDPSLPNRRMRELCRAAGVEVIDLLDALAVPGLYFPQDGHWTSRGNAAAARAVFERLQL